MAILEHTLGILTHPDREWQAIRSERHSFLQVFFSHVPFLALIPCAAMYYGVSQVGWAVGDGEVMKLTSDSALVLAVIVYVAWLVAVYVFGEFINWMSRTYGVKDEEEVRHYEGTALAVYVSVPIFLAGASAIYPEPWFFSLAMLAGVCYAIYLIYEGIPILMNIPKEQAFMYASSVVTIGLVLLVSAFLGSILIWAVGYGPAYIG